MSNCYCHPGKAGGSPFGNSKGCGGVMRMAPIGMFLQGLTGSGPGARSEKFQYAFDLGCEAAALTHGHPTGYLAAGAMAALIFDLLDGTNLLYALDHVLPLLKARQFHEETLAALDKARRLYFSDTASADAIRQLGGGWTAEEALGIGVYCALKAANFEEGVIMAVNHDGDSDSTGLIAGHLLGATRGVSEIPARWLAPLELRDVIEEMADDLATVGTWRLDDSDEPEATAEEAYYTQRYPGA
jgi:ADP-ribosylglycohydrolase